MQTISELQSYLGKFVFTFKVRLHPSSIFFFTYRCILYIVIIYFQNFIVLLCDKKYEITNKYTVVFYQTAFVLILGLSQKCLEGE